MQRIGLYILAAALGLLGSSPALAVCPEGSNWTATWTDIFAETTYTLEAPCKVYLGVAFDITATVTDGAYPENWVSGPWTIVDNGAVIASGSKVWPTAGSWQQVLTVTYSGAPIDHTLEFNFLDLGHGSGGHNFSTSVVGDLTVDPFPPWDIDGDGRNNDVDNCPDFANPDQADSDGDGIGDACEPASDNDGDLLPYAWEVRYGLNPGDPGDALLDLDGDGLSNLAEYQAGTDPLRDGVLPGGYLLPRFNTPLQVPPEDGPLDGQRGLP